MSDHDAHVLLQLRAVGGGPGRVHLQQDGFSLLLDQFQLVSGECACNFVEVEHLGHFGLQLLLLGFALETLAEGDFVGGGCHVVEH